MRTIAELNVLMRVQTELPDGLRVATQEFREGWSFVRAATAKRLEKKIRTRGWNFIKIAGGSLRSGVGDTSQEAIASALKLALRRISEHFNAVEVEHIDMLGEWEESIFLGLRLVGGVSIAELQSFPAVWVDAFVERVQALQRDGLMRLEDGRAMLTQQGRIVSSSIFGELLADEPAVA